MSPPDQAPQQGIPWNRSGSDIYPVMPVVPTEERETNGLFRPNGIVIGLYLLIRDLGCSCHHPELAAGTRRSGENMYLFMMSEGC